MRLASWLPPRGDTPGARSHVGIGAGNGAGTGGLLGDPCRRGAAANDGARGGNDAATASSAGLPRGRGAGAGDPAVLDVAACECRHTAGEELRRLLAAWAAAWAAATCAAAA